MAKAPDQPPSSGQNPGQKAGQDPTARPGPQGKTAKVTRLPATKSAVQDKAPGQTGALLRLLQLEADLRRCPSASELIFHMVNESRAVLGFRQAFVLRKTRGGFRMRAISSVPGFDRNAPLTRWVEAITKSLARAGKAETSQRFTLPEHADPTRDETTSYAFAHMVWVPLKTRKGKVFAGLLLAREKPWPEESLPLSERVAHTYAHAWEALAGARLARSGLRWRWVLSPLVAAAVLALALVKVPLTALAPVEVTGRDAFVVAAPLDGVVDEITVAPNTPVAEGDLLVRFEQTELRNALDIAARAVLVADARLSQLQQAAFTDPNAARDVAQAEAELALAEAERDLAQDRLDRTQVRASRAGIAVFDSALDWTGRPVATGERMLSLADPERVEFTIALPITDSIVLEEGALVKVFLDRDPLTPIRATLSRGSYRASAQEDGALAFTLVAQADADTQANLRIGARGTAQVFGADAPLWFVVFRRPLAWVRQTFGI